MGFEANEKNFVRNLIRHADVYGRPHKMEDRYVLIPAAISDRMGYQTFRSRLHHNSFEEDACGSLGISHEKAWWCSQTRSEVTVPVVKLDYFLSRVPPIYDFFYLKVDVENTDHRVIYGAGSYIEKFEIVTIECRPDDFPDKFVVDSCNQTTMKSYMKKYGFIVSHCDFEDCHFAKKERGMVLLKSIFPLAHTPVSADACHWNTVLFERRAGKSVYQPKDYTIESAYH